MDQKLKIFVASSSESLEIAKRIALWVEDAGHSPIVWSDPGVFLPGEFTYESLLRICREVDAAVVVMNPDDKTWYRKEIVNQPRDNVFVEYGLFSGFLGIKKAIIIKSGQLKNTSDLAGINHISMSEDNPRRAQEEVSQWIKGIVAPGKVLLSQSTDFDKCHADWRVSEIRTHQFGVSAYAKDASNLFFMLLSVVDCARSRSAINSLRGKFHKKVNIEASYNLLGTWDLLVKFRSHNQQGASEFYNDVISILIAQQMITEDEGSAFGKRQLLNIQAQSTSVGGLLSPKKNDRICYVLLPKSEDYDNSRASRAFIYVQAKGNRGDITRIEFLKELNACICDGKGKAIIESICEGEDFLIIETLSTCSQSNLLSHLNRDIEIMLSANGCQKYTLSCYYHDESGLLQNVGHKQRKKL